MLMHYLQPAELAGPATSPSFPAPVPCPAPCCRLTQLASGSADKTIRLWDLKLMEEIAVLEGHRDSVCSVSFTVDGSKVCA